MGTPIFAFPGGGRSVRNTNPKVGLTQPSRFALFRTCWLISYNAYLGDLGLATQASAWSWS
jgi:hypothetical protein